MDQNPGKYYFSHWIVYDFLLSVLSDKIVTWKMFSLKLGTEWHFRLLIFAMK